MGAARGDTSVLTASKTHIMIKFTAPEDRVIRSVTGRVTEKVTDKVTDMLDETSLKILNLLAIDPAYTTTFLAENLSLSRKTVSLRLRHHRTIVSAAFTQSFAPSVQL